MSYMMGLEGEERCMQFLFQPKRYTTNMPPTPVTEEMRSQLIALAQGENVSLAQVQRTAFAVLLRLVNAMHLENRSTADPLNKEVMPSDKMKIYLELVNIQGEDFTR